MGKNSLGSYNIEINNPLTTTISLIDFTRVNTDGLGRIIYYFDLSKFEFCIGDSSTRLTIDSNGCSSNAFTATSDVSLKENVNIVNELNCVNVIKDVSPKTYTRNDLPDTSTRWIGFIAQEVEAALNTHITGGANLIMNTQNGEDAPLKGIDYGRLTTVLWGVCKKNNSKS